MSAAHGLPASAGAVGMVGLGLLGSVLARRLLDAGFRVFGFDIVEARMAALAQLGGTPAASVSEVTRVAPVIVLAVYDTEQVERLADGEISASAGGGRIVVCTATCDPDRLAALARRLALRGVRVVEAPVSGSSAQVAAGAGVALIGADTGVVAEADAVLAAMFPRRIAIGAVGQASRAKLAVNLILGLNRMALAEGLLFAEWLGLDPERFLDVARQSAAYSRTMDAKGPKMVRGDFAAEGRAAQHLKDIRLMLDQMADGGQSLPLARLHAEVLEACVAAGEGDLDNSVIIAELRRRRHQPARRLPNDVDTREEPT